MARKHIVARLVSVLVALVMVAWFVIGVRQAHGTNGATAIVAGSSTLSAAEARRADSLLNEAKLLNPDQQVNIIRGAVMLRSGHPLAAQRILLSVTHSEPKNLEAWLWLAKASGRNRPLFTLALDQVRRLEPLVRTRP